MSATVQPLIEYLQQLQRKGETHVHLDETARKVMREFFMVAKGYKKLNSESQEETTSETMTAEKTEQASRPHQQQVTIMGSSPHEQISSLASQAQKWPAFNNVSTLREKLVFSGGDPTADLMLISDAPGYYEETKGHPFAGPAGQKLDGILKAMGLERSQVYITYLVKFRPAMPNQTTANRKPSDEEIDIFSEFLRSEVAIVKPKVIVALGSVAAQHLTNSNSSTDQLRERFHTVTHSDAPMRVTYHPSYLLQNEANSDKRKLWEDMLAVMKELNMPISEKQKSFFLPKS